ncbi:MAG: hypothetical protein KBT48_06225 [Firmicutes bacterium]|nr:hypothetical protein [Bacillota bacterium]
MMKIEDIIKLAEYLSKRDDDYFEGELNNICDRLTDICYELRKLNEAINPTTEEDLPF